MAGKGLRHFRRLQKGPRRGAAAVASSGPRGQRCEFAFGIPGTLGHRLFHHDGHEFFSQFRKVSWDQVGGLQEVQMYLRRTIEWPLKHPEAFVRFNVPPPKGEAGNLWNPSGKHRESKNFSRMQSSFAAQHRIGSPNAVNRVSSCSKVFQSVIERLF